MFKNRFQYSPEGEGGTPPAGLPLSFAELEALDKNPNAPTITPPADPATPPKPPVIPDPTPAAPATPPAPAAPADPNAPVVPPGEEIVDPPEEQDTPTEDFWEVTEKITGRPVPVTYPEGVEPDTPEGAAVRENAVREQAYDDFDKDLKARNPRGYAFMIHLENGGSEEDFFSRGGGFLLPERVTIDESVDVQTAVYRQDLLDKGLDVDTVEAIVQKAIKDSKLKDRAVDAYERMQTAQEKYLADLELAKKAREAELVSAHDSIAARIEKAVANEISLVVPEAERPTFKKYVIDNLQYDPTTKKYYITQELDTENIKSQVEALLYTMKKGDFSKLIQRKSETVAAQRLRLQTEKTKEGAKKTGGDETKVVKRLSLGEI